MHCLSDELRHSVYHDAEQILEFVGFPVEARERRGLRDLADVAPGEQRDRHLEGRAGRSRRRPVTVKVIPELTPSIARVKLVLKITGSPLHIATSADCVVDLAALDQLVDDEVNVFSHLPGGWSTLAKDASCGLNSTALSCSVRFWLTVIGLSTTTFRQEDPEARAGREPYLARMPPSSEARVLAVIRSPRGARRAQASSLVTVAVAIPRRGERIGDLRRHPVCLGDLDRERPTARIVLGGTSARAGDLQGACPLREPQRAMHGSGGQVRGAAPGLASGALGLFGVSAAVCDDCLTSPRAGSENMSPKLLRVKEVVGVDAFTAGMGRPEQLTKTRLETSGMVQIQPGPRRSSVPVPAMNRFRAVPIRRLLC